MIYMSMDTALEYWDAAAEQRWEAEYSYDCGCCRCCGCDCWLVEVDGTPEEFLWWRGAEEDPPHTPLLDGSSRGTTAFAVRRRK